MTERRYIIGSPERPSSYPLKSTRRAPVLNHEGYARFPTHDDGTGREHSFLYDVRRGEISVHCKGVSNRDGFVAKETDDPDLVAQIDAAAARTAAAMEAWREAQREERDLLAVLAPRCKPARLR